MILIVLLFQIAGRKRREMDLEKLEIMALQREKMPDLLTLHEQTFFILLRGLYMQLHNDYIDREQAAAEKKKIIAQYKKQLRREKFNSNLAKLQSHFFREVEAAASRYAKTRTLEAADELYQTIYKVQIKNSENTKDVIEYGKSETM